MIPTRDAKAQSLRLSALAGYDERSGDIEQALQRNASNPEHAARIVGNWLTHHAQLMGAPSVDELTRLASRTEPEQDRRTWRCAHCDGTGFATVYELHTWHGENRRSVERIAQEHFEWLQTRVANVIGEQVAIATTVRCDECPLGRRRGEAERRDREEARLKREAKGERVQRKQAKSEQPAASDWKRASAGGGDD